MSAERDRITDEYRSLLTDPESLAAFDQNLGLARTVFPYVESHNFYVEHWYHTIFWNKVREFGALLEAIAEPMTIMLWGITTERVKHWVAEDRGSGNTLTGFAGSPGVAEGTARVILDVDRLGELEPGEILVAPVTSPSWTPVFGRIAAAVSDIGGIMSHAAIVSREYGLPAVVGAGDATSSLAPGSQSWYSSGPSTSVAALAGAKDRPQGSS